MTRPVLALALTLALAAAPSTAHALCIYKGELYARPTLAEEFHDARWVVRARVLSASDHVVEGEEPWTEYRLEVREAYKGTPPERLRFFTHRNSGGFYLDNDAGPDIGGDYLLFLNPTPSAPDIPAAARGSVSINYSCGVSRPWAEIPEGARAELVRLAAG